MRLIADAATTAAWILAIFAFLFFIGSVLGRRLKHIAAEQMREVRR